MSMIISVYCWRHNFDLKFWMLVLVLGQILLQMRFKNVAWFRNISGIGPLIDLISTASAGCVELQKKSPK